MLTTGAIEGGSYVLTLAFTDTSGASMVPVTVTWSLKTPSGAIVNSRENVSVASPAATTYIVLSGDDLAILGSGKVETRVIEVTATYTSGTHGALTLKDSETFKIYDPERIQNE